MTCPTATAYLGQVRIDGRTKYGVKVTYLTGILAGRPALIPKQYLHLSADKVSASRRGQGISLYLKSRVV